MSSQQIDVLNSVTRTLIDSCKGYKACIELIDGAHPLKSELERRCSAREALVVEFQARVAGLGGSAENQGSVQGAIHRALAKFTALVESDEKAAFGALDDGEEFLADKIEDRMSDRELSVETLALLQKAHTAAAGASRFFDVVHDNA